MVYQLTWSPAMWPASPANTCSVIPSLRDLASGGREEEGDRLENTTWRQKSILDVGCSRFSHNFCVFL